MTTISANALLSAFHECLGQIADPRIETFVEGLDWAMPIRDLTAHPLQCLQHLPRLARIAAPFASGLTRLLTVSGAQFRWGQTYTAADFGNRFMNEYGWLEVFGSRGHFRSETIAGGLLLLGPHIEYPDHHHVAEEIYVPLTAGTFWRMDGARFVKRPAGEVIYHASNVPHAMRTEGKPLIALYLWRGGPLDQRSIIDARKV